MKGEYNADQNNSRDLLNLESKLESLSKQSQLTGILDRLHENKKLLKAGRLVWKKIWLKYMIKS